MKSSTIREMLTRKDSLSEEAYHIYLFRDGDTVFYIGQAVNTYNRFLSHVGMDGFEGSKVGTLLIENTPACGDWAFEEYTLEDCCKLLDLSLTEENVNSIEKAMIEHYRPCLNIACNPSPGSLPIRYVKKHTSILAQFCDEIDQDENPYGEKLAAMLGIK